MTDEMDSEFGILRDAVGDDDSNEDGRKQWEVDMTPVSISTLSDELGSSLVLFLQAAGAGLLQAASRSLTFLWGMEADGKIKIAVEEVVKINGADVPRGFPSRRGLRSALTLDDKLGHPCILDSKRARIAGELYLDTAQSNDGSLRWTVNAKSGRFHEPPDRRPTRAQLASVAKVFGNAIGTPIEIERIRDFPPFNPSIGRPV